MLTIVKNDPIPTGVAILPFIATAMEKGRDPISDPTRDGGIFVTDDIVAIAADMEVVVKTTFKGSHEKFHLALLQEIGRAYVNGDNPIEEVGLWLTACLEEDTTVLST